MSILTSSPGSKRFLTGISFTLFFLRRAEPTDKLKNVVIVKIKINYLSILTRSAVNTRFMEDAQWTFLYL